MTPNLFYAGSSILKPTKATRPGKKRKQEAKTRHEAWREAVIETGKVGDRYRCFHCERLFPRDEICADHWPETKGSNPARRYDPSNGVPPCQLCNTSGSPLRKQP